MTAPVVHTRNLGRRFGEKTVLEGIDLDVPPGQLLGLLGPNGAGKSTLISLLVGLRRPTTGVVKVLGLDPRSDAVRRLIGVTPQETALPAAWKVGEVFDFVAAHFPGPLAVGELAERFGLGGLLDRQAGGLSGGQQRRVAVALAFVGRPRLVVLDEPTTGLDVEARRGLWEGIRSFRDEGGTVLLTSHYIEEVETLADRVVVMNRGRILADGDVTEIRGRVPLTRVTLAGARLPDLRVLHAATGIEQDGARIHLLTHDARTLVHELVHHEIGFDDISIETASLEDAFVALTGEASTA